MSRIQNPSQSNAQVTGTEADPTRREFAWSMLTGAAALAFLGELSGCSKEASPARAADMSTVAAATREELSKIYAEQQQKGGKPQAAAEALMNEVCLHLAARLGTDRFPQQPQDYHAQTARTQLSKAMLEHGYVFRIGTSPANGGNCISAQLYRIDSVNLPFEYPKVQLGARNFTPLDGLVIRARREVFVEPYDYQSKQVSPGRVQKTLLVGSFVPELNIILFDSAAAIEYGRLKQRDTQEIKRDVLLNEYGHACLHGFMRGIKDPNGLQIDLQGRTFSFHQVDEAFSDYVSLKYSQTDLFPLIDRAAKEPPDSDYGFSAVILNIGMSTFSKPWENQPAVTPADLVPSNSPAPVARDLIVKYLVANPSAAQAARERLLTVYGVLLGKALEAFDSERR